MGKNNIQNIFICVSQKKHSDRLGTTLVSVSPSVIPVFLDSIFRECIQSNRSHFG